MARLFAEREITLYAKTKESCVKTAIEALKKDLGAVFGKNVRQVIWKNADVVVLSSKEAETEFKDSELTERKELLDETGNYRFEGYLLAEKEGSLFIIGNDKRGIMYGIYDLSRRIGVSPWHFFADVPIKKREYWEIPDGYRSVQYPSVRYRGIFINDEEELENWAKKHTSDETIGPETYRLIFDLLLRLRANYIWPAMHVNCFNGNPENGRLAQEMGIIVGTSHCDMLMRSNHNEWRPWLASKGYDRQETVYDYSIEGSNREKIKEYWTEGVMLNRGYDVTYTVGMRGIHDSGFTAERIDKTPGLSEEERFAAKSRLLEQIISDQRKILSGCLNKKAEDIPQIFVLYKEVLEYYDNGLKLPEDITIIWTDDNYGYVRRYPDPQDRKRKGGHGLYYHSSYWEATNMHYLFISSTPLARMKNELGKAWDNGIQKLWVLNIGAVKPLEQDLEFYTRYAWEVGKEETTKNVEKFLADWIDSEFSGGIGEKTGKLLNQFTRLVNVRKIELLDRHVFSQNAFGDEAAMRLKELKEIFDEANEIAQELPLSEREAYFQLVQMKIHAAYYKNQEIYFADRSALMYRQGRMNAADAYCRISARYTTFLRWMLDYYNRRMCGGKWEDILTPETAPPPNMFMYPVTKPALKIGKPQLSVTLWQGAKKSDELVFSKYGQREKWLEIANLGKGILSFRIVCDPWIKLSQTEGKVETEVRIMATVDQIEKHMGECGSIRIYAPTGENIVVPVSIYEQAEPEQMIPGTYMEADGYIAMHASGFSRLHGQRDAFWRIVPYLGRPKGDGLEAYSPCLLEPGEEERWEEHPSAEYSFYLETPGSHLLELFRLQTLNSVGRIRIGVQTDAGSIRVLESAVTDEHRGNWRETVKNEADRLFMNLPYLKKGHHFIRLYMIDSYVLISKIVIYTQGYAYTSLGPEQSTRAGEIDKRRTFCPIPLTDAEIAEKGAQWYRCQESEIPIPSILYADQDYYKGEEWIKGTWRGQERLGKTTYGKRSDGTKDVVKDFLLGRKITEQNGKIRIEAEAVLAQDGYAWHTPSVPGAYKGEWEHLGTATSNGSGLGMFIDARPGILWEDPFTAPSLNYVMDVSTPGEYFLWFYVKYDDCGEDSVRAGINGRIIPAAEQYSKNGFFNYRYLNLHVWHWNLFAKVSLKRGRNFLSVFGRSALVKIDRIYLSLTAELPPLDAEWGCRS